MESPWIGTPRCRGLEGFPTARGGKCQKEFQKFVCLGGIRQSNSKWFRKDCKPNSVCAETRAAAERIICLSGQYPGPAALSRDSKRAASQSPIWPCTRWGLPCLRARAWSGALLPHLFTLAAPACAGAGGLILCGTFRRLDSRPSRPRVSPAEPELRGIAPCGVRTFLPGLRRSDSPPFRNRVEITVDRDDWQGA